MWYYVILCGRARAYVSTISSTDCTALLLHYSRVHLYFLNLVIGFHDDAKDDILATFPAIIRVCLISVTLVT